MKEMEYVADTRDWTRDMQIFSLTVSPNWAISADSWLMFTLK